MKKRILSIVLSIVMLVSLLPTTALATEASTPEASWVFSAAGIRPDYTGATTGTLTEAFAAANNNEDSTTIYVQLNENVIAENNQYFSLNSNKSMVLDLNEKTISSSNSIYCIYTLSGSSLTVKNGTITVKETKNTGYGFFVNGALTVENCTINAEQTSSNSVYGINGRKGSSLTVKNSSITAKNTESSGSTYGIYADQGTLTVEKCNISAESSNRNAYGINTSYTGASISEGTISAQTESSSYRAYGVYSSYGNVTLSGTPAISGTTADFYYPSTGNYKVVFTRAMSAPDEPYSFVGLSGYGFTSGAYLCNINANNFSSYFESADPTEEVIYDNGELKLVSKPYVWFCTGDGTDVDNIYLPYGTGGTATRPADPTWEGYTFAGWYADDTYTTEFDFSQTITQNTGVYAKWTFAATGAEVEDSETLNGTYGSTLDELIEAMLSKLSITVTGKNGESLGGFSTSNWTVKSGQDLAAAQLGDTVIFVGTLTAPTATNYNDTYDYWYGRLPQWEGELSVEVPLVLNYNVKFSNYNYTTNSDGIMAYILRERSNYYIFDIIGYFDSNWRSTTYGNGGYKTYLKVGDTVEQMSTTTSAGGGDTKLELNVAIDFDFLNQGQTLQIKYTVNNTTGDAIAFSLGSGADVKIGSDDSALITPFADGSGYKMVSDKSDDQSAKGDYAQFNFFGKGYVGVTNVTDFWYGGWSRSDATNGCYWTSNESVAAFYGVAQSESLNDDSAASWHWDDSIGAGETKTYSVLISIGGAGSENAAHGSGLTEPTGSVTIEVSEELTNSSQLVVKLGETTLTEDIDYTVDLSVPDKPVITFQETTGLNVSSGDLTVTVTFADQRTEDVTITNSIPGTGNISTEEGVMEDVTAEGLDELAKEQNRDIVLTVKEEEKNTEDVEHNAIDTAAGDKIVEFLDITLKDKNSGDLITGELSAVLEIAVPFDGDGKSDITVYRYHDSAVNTFTMLDSKPADEETRADGTFFVDGESNKLYIYTDKFSTYAIGYTTPPIVYSVTVQNNGNGVASASHTSATAGTQITLTVIPASGYHFKEWQVDYPVDLRISENKFTMPAGNVGIMAIFEADTPSTYTVTFNMNGHGTAINPATVSSGEKVTKPADPSATGYVFGGWYKEQACETAWDFDTDTVSGATTLYAKWTANTYAVTLNVGGATINSNDVTSYTYGVGATLPTAGNMTKESYRFDGWYESDDFSSSPVAEISATATGNKTYYAKWTEVHTITGVVKDSNSDGIDGVKVKLMQGGTQFGTQQTNSNGEFSFTSVPLGSYNVVAVQDTKTKTELVIIAHTDETLIIVMPSQNVSSTLNVSGSSTPDVVVGGLDDEAADQTHSNAANQNTHVSIGMSIESKEDVTSGGGGSSEEATQQAAIKQAASTQQLDKVEFLSITVTKTVTTNGTPDNGTELEQTQTVLELIIPYSLAGKYNIGIYRHHDGRAEAFAALGSKPDEQAKRDKTFWIDEGNDLIHIYTNRFSIYAIAYSDAPVVTPAPDPTPSGGGNYTPTYAITVEKAENGEVKANRSYASSGSTVTLTVTPKDGYVLDELTVTDSQNNKIELTDKGDGTYTFKMPRREVTVEASFVAAGSFSVCPKDDTCPIWPFTDAETTAWYHDGVHYCVENGLMSGYGNGIFKPNAATTRAMITVMLWRLNGSPVVNYLLDFEDVEQGKWYTEAIRWAKSEGIAAGYGNGCFGTDDAVTREQMVTILWRYAQYKGADVSVGEDTNILSYNDAFDVAEYAIPAMQWACGSGMVQGMNDPDGEGMILAPESKGTRAQIATMMMRFCTEIVQK